MREDGRHHPIHLSNHSHGNRSTIVFVTVCAEKRKPILASEQAVQAILEAWKRADEWIIGRYVILPDHIHLFCSPTADAPQLKRWIAYWKSEASKNWPQQEQHPIWQRDFWDRQLRTGESYESKWAYVYNNPVRHGLVSRPEDWPYAGKIATLEWMD